MQRRDTLRHHHMRLQLWTPHTECRFILHRSHGRIWSENHLNIVIKIHSEIDLTGVAMGPTSHIAKIGMSFSCATAGWTKQIPRHVENAGLRGTQEHLKD